MPRWTLQSLGLLLMLLALPDVTNAVESCDCGVVWASRGVPGTGYNLAVAFRSYTGVASYDAVPVNNLVQAQLICYQDTYCRGTAYSPVFNVAYMFTDPPTPGVFSASTGLSSTSVLGSPTAFLVYTIDRAGSFFCDDDTLDEYYYYFLSGSGAVRLAIESDSRYCPHLHPYTQACCWDAFVGSACMVSNPTISQANASPGWKAFARLHWATVGHARRYSPRAACTLTPTPWTEASHCVTPQTGCWRENCDDSAKIPCGGLTNGGKSNGVCVATLPSDNNITYPYPYHCQCRTYQGLFSNIPQYMGIACAHPTASGCRELVNSNQMCSDNDLRCRPQAIFTEDCAVSGYNDVTPACDCDSAPAAIGNGVFCEVDRCDPPHAGYSGRCQTQGSLAGECAHTGPGTLDFACDCTYLGVGDLCQYSPATCIFSSDLFHCRGLGTCFPPGLSAGQYPLAVYPNYQSATAWCNCSASRSYGSKCQFLACDPTLVTAGRGVCEPLSGNFQNCLLPYSDSGQPGALKCDVDRCLLYGGVTIGNPPNDCNCGGLRHGTGSDITCYPRCPLYNGVECGSGGVCQQVEVVENGTPRRYARCVCGSDGYVVTAYNNTLDPYVRPPPGEASTYCTPFCLHGTLPSGWNQAVPTACVCPNTGYDTQTVGGVTHLRCDRKICQNGGEWNTVTQRCDCPIPYLTATNCATSRCDNAATSFVEGTVVANSFIPGTNICSCNAPYIYASAAVPTDCSANRCIYGGSVNPALTSSTLVAQMCICDGVRNTTCSDSAVQSCVFCSGTKCEHGGVINPLNSNLCVCSFPYNVDALCHDHACGTHGNPVGSTCVCTFGFTGTTCNTSPCAHGSFNDTSRTCSCSQCFTGSTCATAVPGCTASSSTGVSSSSSSSSTARGSSTGLFGGGDASSSSSTGSATTNQSSTAAAPVTPAAAASATSSNALAIGLGVSGGAVVLVGAGYLIWQGALTAAAISTPVLVPISTATAAAAAPAAASSAATAAEIAHSVAVAGSIAGQLPPRRTAAMNRDDVELAKLMEEDEDTYGA